MSAPPEISEQMRADWNRRASEDAHYYVAFGRRDQPDEEFFATAEEVVAGLNWEYQRLGPGNARARRALEIGCGPGRLIRPMAARFGEIHGIDVSDEMIVRARENLRGIPHAHLHATDGSSLAMFADDSFDMVYSYAVFQHIPSKDVVLNYLREARRALKAGGILRAQFNGLPDTAARYDTWSGVRFTADELVAFTREYDFQMLALEGFGTQYMWTTWRKREPGWRGRAKADSERADVPVRKITNAQNAEPVAPASGRYASFSVWVTKLPEAADLFDIEVLVDGAAARQTYIGPPDAAGAQQINAVLPRGVRTGLVPVEVRWFGRTITRPAAMRVIPAGPQIPRVIAISDGINLMSGLRIDSGVVKVSVEELDDPDRFSAAIAGAQAGAIDRLCVEPQSSRWEFNFGVPEHVRGGAAEVELRIGRRVLATAMLEIVR